MNQTATVGTNRTGMTAAPERGQEMLAGMEEFPPTAQGSAHEIAQVCIAYAQLAEPPGSVPLPPTLKGNLATAVETIKGDHPIFFLDKLGVRLAFERTGTRLYNALLSKYDAYGSFTAGPSRDDLEHVREEEHRHCTLLQAAIA